MSRSDKARERGIFDSYRALGPGRLSDDQIVTILERYNLSWLGTDPAAKHVESPEYHSTIDSDEAHTDSLRGVYRVPLLYRLAFIRQLSTVALTTHLEATHSRLAHALGTAEVAGRMLEVLEKETSIDPVYRRACVLYAFLHDAFHGPMGHSLDIMRDVFGIAIGQKIDDAQFRYALGQALSSNSDEFGRQLVLAAEFVHPQDPHALLSALRDLSDPALLRRKHPSLLFLRDIIDSELDADRIDYIARDAMMLERMNLPLAKLVTSARAIDEGGEKRLAFSLRRKPEAIRALSVRRRFYSDYYEAPQKLVVDDMICHALYYILRDLNLTGNRSLIAEEEHRKRIMRHILLLIDGDFFPALAEFRVRPICYDLTLRVMQRRYYSIIYQRGISRSEVAETREMVRSWMDRLSIETARLASERGGTRYMGAYVDPDDITIFESVTRDELPDPEKRQRALVFQFQAWYQGNFLARHMFERSVWRTFCDSDANARLRKQYIADEYGSVDMAETILPLLDEFPPLHVTTSSYFEIETPEDLEHYPKEGSHHSEGVLFYKEGERKGERVVVETEIRAHQPQFPLILAVPDLLEKHAREALIDAFQRELESCGWMWGDLRDGRQSLQVGSPHLRMLK